MDFQTFANGAFGLLGLLGGWMLNRIWTAVDHLQSQDQILTDKVQAIEVLVAGKYVTRIENQRDIEKLFLKLDSIERKIDQKADK